MKNISEVNNLIALSPEERSSFFLAWPLWENICVKVAFLPSWQVGGRAGADSYCNLIPSLNYGEEATFG